MPEDFPYDVFLSHSAKDKAVVRPLAERLRQDASRRFIPLLLANCKLPDTLRQTTPPAKSPSAANWAVTWPGEGFKRAWPPLIKMDDKREGEGGDAL